MICISPCHFVYEVADMSIKLFHWFQSENWKWEHWKINIQLTILHQHKLVFFFHICNKKPFCANSTYLCGLHIVLPRRPVVWTPGANETYLLLGAHAASQLLPKLNYRKSCLIGRDYTFKTGSDRLWTSKQLFALSSTDDTLIAHRN